MSHVYGYHRISTKEQKLDRGIIEITQFCQSRKLELVKIYTDVISGKKYDRPRYTVLKEDILRNGDILIITEIDRLGRNKKENLKELEELISKGIRIMILEIPTTLIDIGTIENETAKMMIETINNILIELYSSIAEAEMKKREKRQREGIAAMRKNGDWDRYGRPKSMTLDEFKNEYKRVENGEIGTLALIRELGISKTTFYRYKKQIANS